MRTIGLSAFHYAADWPLDALRTPAELTELGCQMAGLPEGSQKEAKLLEILQCFHGYLFKYMSMILRGQLPLQRTGKSRDINRDTHLLLQCFVPKDKALNKASLAAACRTLHLAFKGMSSDEVFDQLMMCLVKSVRRYDPFFHEKIKQVVDAIEGETLRDRKLFTTAAVTRAVGYDCPGYLRYLTKRLFLVAVAPAVPGEPQYKRTAEWPPAPAFFQAGSVGLSYFASKWFRYFLVDFINDRMAEIEAKEGVLQLHHDQDFEQGRPFGSVSNPSDHGLSHRHGNYVNPRTGRAAAVDLTLCKSPMDIGKLNLDWVHNTQKHLFVTLSKHEGHLLYCVYARDMDWEGIASTFDMNIREAKRWHQAILEKLQEKIKGVPLEVNLEDLEALVEEEAVPAISE